MVLVFLGGPTSRAPSSGTLRVLPTWPGTNVLFILHVLISNIMYLHCSASPSDPVVARISCLHVPHQNPYQDNHPPAMPTHPISAHHISISWVQVPTPPPGATAGVNFHVERQRPVLPLLSNVLVQPLASICVPVVDDYLNYLNNLSLHRYTLIRAVVAASLHCLPLLTFRQECMMSLGFTT